AGGGVHPGPEGEKLARRRPARPPAKEGAGPVRGGEDPPDGARVVAARRGRRRGGRGAGNRRGPGRTRDEGGTVNGQETELERAVGEILIDEDRLNERIRELGREISADYEG